MRTRLLNKHIGVAQGEVYIKIIIFGWWERGLWSKMDGWAGSPRRLLQCVCVWWAREKGDREKFSRAGAAEYVWAKKIRRPHTNYSIDDLIKKRQKNYSTPLHKPKLRIIQWVHLPSGSFVETMPKPSAKHLGFIASNLDKINVESDLRRVFNLSC